MNRRNEFLSDHPLAVEQHDQLFQLLQTAKEGLLRNARSGLELSMNRNDVGRDSIDESTEEGMLSTALRLRDREKKLLKKIEKALVRLEEGIIDECEECGESIGFKRLLVRPVTTLCISCKELSEAQEDAYTSSSRGKSYGFSVGRGRGEADR